MKRNKGSKNRSSRISAADRRGFLKLAGAAGVATALPWSRLISNAHAVPAALGLSDPALQPKFVNTVPNALDPGFIYTKKNNKFKIAVRQAVQMTGLVDGTGTPLPTTIWGYGENGQTVTWPGRTFQVQSGEPIEVTWQNKLLDNQDNPLAHLLPVDTSLHWAYSLAGFEQYNIATNGVPIVTHLHGGHRTSSSTATPSSSSAPATRSRARSGKATARFSYDNDSAGR